MRSEITFFTTGDSVTDPSTGEVVQPKTTVWFGPCRVRPNDAQASPVEVGGAELFAYDYLVTIPFEVDEVVEHLRGTVTSSPDPALVGITVEVQKVARGDDISGRRLLCTEVV